MSATATSSKLGGGRTAIMRCKDARTLTDGLDARVANATERRTRVFISAANRLLQEELARMVSKKAEMDVVGTQPLGPFRAEALLEEGADLFLLASRGNLTEDIGLIRNVRTTAPSVEILLVGVSGDELEFLQYVRAGIKGYVLSDASAEEVLEALRAVQSGKAVCPAGLCALLFRYFEREATSLPSASVHLQLGLTRREQQLVPLIAQGLTNKEIANHFCLSEQTVKNHLYRMKHKVRADGRLGIVQVCRTQGFMV